MTPQMNMVAQALMDQQRLGKDWYANAAKQSSTVRGLIPRMMLLAASHMIPQAPPPSTGLLAPHGPVTPPLPIGPLYSEGE